MSGADAKQALVDVVTNGALRTIAEGEAFAQSLVGGEIVGLEGNLGSGKTTFVKGLARGLRIDDRTVDSPSFKLVNQYHGQLTLNHVDLYRLINEEDILNTGIFDLLDGESVMVVEWVDKLGSLDLRLDYLVEFQYLSSNQRRIIITPTG